MPDVASVLKQEIKRLARKEIAATAQQQSKQIQSLKATVRSLRDRVAALEKTLSRWPTERSHANSQPPAEAAPQGAIRISPKSLRNHRRRLKLSQAQTGKLLGVSTASVTFWELGRTSPRGKNRKAIAELRQMSARDAKLLLETLSMEGAADGQGADDLWYTFRVDASYDLKRNVTGIGIVVGARVKPKKSRPGPTLTELAEAYVGIPPDLCEKFAVFRALELACGHGARRVQICSDDQQLRRVLKQDLEARTGLDRVDLHGDLLRLAATLDQVKFPWYRRRRNVEAHRLSRIAVRDVPPKERNDLVWHQESCSGGSR